MTINDGGYIGINNEFVPIKISISDDVLEFGASIEDTTTYLSNTECD